MFIIKGVFFLEHKDDENRVQILKWNSIEKLVLFRIYLYFS